MYEWDGNLLQVNNMDGMVSYLKLNSMDGVVGYFKSL